MKLPFISKTGNMFLFTQLRTVSDHSVVTATPHGEIHKGVHLISNKCHTNVSANVKLLCFLASSSHCDYYQRCVCSETSPHAKRWPVDSPGDSKSRLKSRLTFYDLVIFIQQYQIATTSPPTPSPHGRGVKLRFAHQRKNIGRYCIMHSSYLEKAQ